MDQPVENPIDDDLLRELGLEPSIKTEPAKAPPPPPPKTASAPKAPAARPAASEVSQKTEIASMQNPQAFSQGVKNIVADMPVQVVAVLGKRSMSMKEVLNLKPGEILELKKLPQESIDLVANGKLLARGELVLIDGKVGVQVKQII